MSILKVKEGLVEIYVPKISTELGPGKKGGGYYSKPMIFSRDLTIMILKALANPNIKALDGLSSTGVRGIRIAKEAGIKIELNDRSHYAVKLIKRNLELNNIDLNVTQMALNDLLQSKKYDYIDIDPYGSFVPYLESAIESLNSNGIIGITTTDLPNFTGTNKNKGLKKYGSIGIRNYLKQEAGLRIMIAYIAKLAASYNFGIEPFVSVYHDYYYRTFIKFKKGAKESMRTLNNIQTISTASLLPKLYGPFWIGNLHNLEFIKKLKNEKYFESYKLIEKYLTYFNLENMLFFYSTEELCNRLKISQLKVDTIISRLKKMGFEASRTQFDPLGIKTHASYLRMKEAILSS